MADESDDNIVENDLETDTEEEEEEESEVEEKAPVRSSAAYFIGKRQGKREAKEELEGEEKDGDTELTPKARTAIQKELAPIIQLQKKNADELDLREHFALHPEDKKYEKAIRRRMEDWDKVPVGEIAKTVKFGKDQEERSEKKKEAVERSKGSRMSGTSAREEEVSLPTAEQHKDIYAHIKKGEQMNLETGKWERATR